MELKFYNATICPYAQRTKLTLIEKGVEFEEIKIDLKNKPSWFPEVSPYGKVPAIMHNDKSIYESNVVNEYIDEVFAGKKLLSDDAYLRAQMRIWMAFCGDAITPNHYGLLRSQDEQQREVFKARLTEKLAMIDAHIKENKGEFFFGQDISLVDLTFFPFFKRFCTLKHYRNFSIPAEFECLLNWLATMEQRDSVKQSSESDEFYIDFYRSYAEA